MIERIASHNRKREERNDAYLNCNFELGSLAEVERLWSIAKHVLTDSRKGITPLAFEEILFLRMNNTYWNEYTVKETMTLIHSKKVEQKVNENNEHFALVQDKFVIVMIELY